MPQSTPWNPHLFLLLRSPHPGIFADHNNRTAASYDILYNRVLMAPDEVWLCKAQLTTYINLPVSSEAIMSVNYLDPSLRPNATASTALTALPIWSTMFPRAGKMAGWLVLDRVTLILPVSDYAALYAYAVVGGPGGIEAGKKAYPGWSGILTSGVLDRIPVFDVARSVLLSFHARALNWSNVIVGSSSVPLIQAPSPDLMPPPHHPSQVRRHQHLC